MLRLYYGSNLIEIFDDIDYSLNSADNVSKYDEIIMLEVGYAKSDYNAYSAKYCITIHKDGATIKRIILLGQPGLPSKVNEQTAIIDDDRLVIINGYHVCCISMSDFSLLWKLNTESAGCFGVYLFDDGYVIHGETDIVKVSKKGEREWSFSGRDIFASPDGSNTFEIKGNDILLKDWDNHSYRINKNGIEIK